MTATPQGSFSTFTVDVMLFAAGLITETVLLPEFVIYTNGVPPAILISIKIIAVEAKAIEHNFCLVIMH